MPIIPRPRISKRLLRQRHFYDPGFNSIDGFIVKRDKNDYVLIIKDNRKPGYSDLSVCPDHRRKGLILVRQRNLHRLIPRDRVP